MLSIGLKSCEVVTGTLVLSCLDRLKCLDVLGLLVAVYFYDDQLMSPFEIWWAVELTFSTVLIKHSLIQSGLGLFQLFGCFVEQDVDFLLYHCSFRA